MIAAIDAQYDEHRGSVACVTFEGWTDAAPSSEHHTLVENVAEYQPGEFWRRELPCIQRVLQLLHSPPDIIVIDGYVFLDEDERPGLGAHLHAALGARCAVIGVAKHAFKGSAHAVQVHRGGSERPLFVTTAGLKPTIAALAIQSMHGEHRIPTLLKRVDQLCRAHLH